MNHAIIVSSDKGYIHFSLTKQPKSLNVNEMKYFINLLLNIYSFEAKVQNFKFDNNEEILGYVEQMKLGLLS